MVNEKILLDSIPKAVRGSRKGVPKPRKTYVKPVKGDNEFCSISILNKTSNVLKVVAKQLDRPVKDTVLIITAGYIQDKLQGNDLEDSIRRTYQVCLEKLLGKNDKKDDIVGGVNGTNIVSYDNNNNNNDIVGGVNDTNIVS